MAVIWITSCKKRILEARDIKSMLFIIIIIIIIIIILAFRTYKFFAFLVSIINHYLINGLHPFWDNFE